MYVYLVEWAEQPHAMGWAEPVWMEKRAFSTRYRARKFIKENEWPGVKFGRVIQVELNNMEV